MTKEHLYLSMLIPAAYLLGSVPFGLIIGLSKGVDPRKAGSGNIGATNLGRLLGGKFFAICFILDLHKSLVPMLLAAAIVHYLDPNPPAQRSATTYVLWLAVGFAAIVGHMFSIFLKFRGGKGVATSAGVLLGLYPYYTIPGLLAIVVWLGVFLAWRYVSLASIVGSTSFVLIYIAAGLFLGWPILSRQLPLLIAGALIATLVVVRHRSNISRLLAGTEHAFRRA